MSLYGESEFKTLSSGFNGYRERAANTRPKVPRDPVSCARAIFERFPGSRDFIESVISELQRRLEERFGPTR